MLKKALSLAIQGLLWFYAGARLMMDWVGRSTFFGDLENAKTLGESALLWLFSTPSWVPTALAFSATVISLWLLRHPQAPNYTESSALPEAQPALSRIADRCEGQLEVLRGDRDSRGYDLLLSEQIEIHNILKSIGMETPPTEGLATPLPVWRHYLSSVIPPLRSGSHERAIAAARNAVGGP